MLAGEVLNAGPTPGADQPKSGDQALERKGLGEFRADPIARNPFDHRVGTRTSGKH